MFRLLARYIFREILTSAVLGTLLATFVLFLHGLEDVFELLVGSTSATLPAVVRLFAYAIPPVLPLTIPFGVLVGILIGLGRMAADGEIVAMRATGVSTRKMIVPVLAFAAMGTAIAGYASLALTPAAIRESVAIFRDLATSQLSADVQPRVFVENFPNTIIYIGDVSHTDPIRWKSFFLADVGDPEKRRSGIQEKAVGPLIWTAREAIAQSFPLDRRMQLSLRDGFKYEMGKDGTAHDSEAPRWELDISAAPAPAKVTGASAMSTRQLLAYKSGPELTENRIELHKRFALPVACLMLALVGLPLGVATRRGGRSAGYVNAVVLAFFVYWLALTSLLSIAKQGSVPIPVAVWLPNVVFGIAGAFLIARMERPGDRDIPAMIRAWLLRRAQAFNFLMRVPERKPSRVRQRVPLLPQVIDTYVLSHFLLYFAVLLGSFVALTQIWNFFELTGDMVRNKIPLATMFKYLFFLTPELIYRTLPISVLVAVLVTFGVLSKQNEITAFKACGVSLYRLALPVLITGAVLSVALFTFDYYYVPGANRRQDALRAEIKGKPTQTFLNPKAPWIMGSSGSRIYYYRYFDAAQNLMGDLNVFELNPKTFAMVRQVTAERARWSPSLKTWVLENGGKSDFINGKRHPETFQVASFPEFSEPPDYFLKEAVPSKQMNFMELESYISDLQTSGFDTLKLQVQFHRKFAAPLFALIMALIALPFGFSVGNRGAMTGIGLSIGIAMAYWGLSTLFDKIGGAGQLDPSLAAWSPDVMFSLAGLYFLLRVRS